ncbi:MAG: formate dehydrogenase family accessory protein FdhD [Candidatus Altiarchaeales archaeon WOR_SM1_79]|nr:MAG: formate dehydrogenase family accessory protein FdhD [Candidatus Altiarchaeales archaeon WOR_SM1_79]
MLKKVHCVRLDGDKAELEDEIAEEVPLVIFVNGKHFSTAMISPQMREEFVTGHLFTEGIIDGPVDIESLKVESNTAKVLTRHSTTFLESRKVILSGCGSTSSFLDKKKLPKICSNLMLDRTMVLNAMKAVLRSDNFKRSGGFHSCGLFNESGAIIVVDDIGRHNALDKVIGFGLIRNLDLKDTFIATTGRISSDVALKCARANIPVIASKGAVTTLAVEIAENSGLTTAGFVRGNKMNIYSGGRIN